MGLFEGGFLTRLWSTIFKWAPILRRKIRHKARIVEHLLPHIRLLIYERIPQEVLKDHNVSRADRDQLTAVKEADKVERAESDVGFNVEVEEVLSLDRVRDILRMMLEHAERNGPTGHEIKFANHVLERLGISRAESREIYFKFLEPILRVAELKGDHKALMEVIRLLGNDQTNIFSAIALRLDIRASGLGLSKLGRDKKELQVILTQYSKKAGQTGAIEQELTAILARIEKDVDVLHSDALVEKRDFLLTILLLKYINYLESTARQFSIDVLMPKIPEQKRIEDIEELKKRLSEDMHVLAQGMRRILAAEQDIEKLAKQLEAVAKSKRPVLRAAA